MSEPATRRKTYPAPPATRASRQIFVEPHSPWQLLIESKREEKGISIRKLATAAKIPDATMFNWLRAKRGCPLPQYYTANVNLRIATALTLPPAELADAYNRSQPQLDPDALQPEPAPAPPASDAASIQVDGLRRFMGMVRATEAQTFTLGELEAMAAVLLK